MSKQLTVIQQKIYDVRGEKIMLDFDLAEVYGVETRVLNQAVKRNRDKFPKRYMFQLKAKEWEFLRSQIVILEKGKGKFPKYLPYAFTEHGVTMLASVLKSKRAVRMNISVVDAFVFIKQIALKPLGNSSQLQQLKDEIYKRLSEHDIQLAAIYDVIENILDEKAENKSWQHRERIGFKKN
jgi:hypothetical protein